MSEYTPITGELRNWFEHAYSYDVGETPWFGWKSTIEQMLDAIDSIHAALEAENERLREQDRDGWVELPKDADGEYIRIGDEVETTNFGTVEVEGFVHRAVAFYNYSEQPAYLCTTPANLCRHHHTPTVEDVLREMLDAWGELPSNATNDAIVAEYAKRLTLAGDAE